MASQPSVTSVAQKRGAKLPKVKSDVGEIPFPGGLSLREMDAAPTQGAEDRARPSLSEADIVSKIHPGGARPKLLPARFQQTVQVGSPDPDLEPGPQLDETNPWSHASMLLHTSPTSRFSSSPHQPGKSPSSAMEPLSLEKRMTRGVTRGRRGTTEGGMDKNHPGQNLPDKRPPDRNPGQKPSRTIETEFVQGTFVRVVCTS